MTNPNLVEMLKTLGYNNDTIRKMTAAADAVEIERVEASRAGMTELLTPLQAAAESPKHRLAVIQANSLVKKLSGMKYSLEPFAQPVDIFALNEAIKDADVADRIALRTQLAQLNLIP